MKLGRALHLVLHRWNMSHYRLAKTSGVGQATIGKLVRGALESSTWDVVERLADGFEKLDPMAKIAFLGVLSLPNSAYSAHSVVSPLPYGYEEDIEEARRFLEAARRLELLNEEAFEALADRGLPVEQLINMEMQKLLVEEESDRDA